MNNQIHRENLEIIDLEEQIVARLVARGLSHKEIASEMAKAGFVHISEATVSRRRDAAEKRGILIEVDDLSQEQRQCVDERLYGGLRKILRSFALRYSRNDGVLLRAVHVLPSGGLEMAEPGLNDPWDSRFKVFRRPAALQIREYLADMRTQHVGISHGRTVAEPGEALAEIGAKDLRRDSPIRFLQLCGQPMASPDHPHAAINVTKRYCRLINGSERFCGVYRDVQAFIQRGLSEEVRTGLFNHFRRNPVYNELLGSGHPNEHGMGPLVQSLDLILVSCSQSPKIMGDELHKVAGFSKEEIEDIVLGDLGSAVIPKGTIDPDAPDASLSRQDLKRVKLFREIRDTFTGPTLRDYARVAKMAQETGKPGVVVICMGKNKLDVFLEIVRRGLANEVLIDGELGDAINSRFNTSNGL